MKGIPKLICIVQEIMLFIISCTIQSSLGIGVWSKYVCKPRHMCEQVILGELQGTKANFDFK